MPHDRSMALRGVLHQIRGDLTQEAFAQRVGVSAALIARAEAGKRSISTDTVDKIIAAMQLDETTADLLYAAREAASNGLSPAGRRDDDLAELVRTGFREIDAKLSQILEAVSPPVDESTRLAVEERHRQAFQAAQEVADED